MLVNFQLHRYVCRLVEFRPGKIVKEPAELSCSRNFQYAFQPVFFGLGSPAETVSREGCPFSGRGMGQVQCALGEFIFERIAVRRISGQPFREVRQNRSVQALMGPKQGHGIVSIIGSRLGRRKRRVHP